jgi:hypothetical protein
LSRTRGRIASGSFRAAGYRFLAPNPPANARSPAAKASHGPTTARLRVAYHLVHIALESGHRYGIPSPLLVVTHGTAAPPFDTYDREGRFGYPAGRTKRRQGTAAPVKGGSDWQLDNNTVNKRVCGKEFWRFFNTDVRGDWLHDLPEAGGRLL